MVGRSRSRWKSTLRTNHGLPVAMRMREAASRFAREEHRCALLGVHLDPPEAEPLAQQVERLLESTCYVTLFGIGRKESGVVGARRANYFIQ
ncbi:jg14843 [Pararge aegeria aegeria]|uniref:Jg14843 protein n=1 Tax=Pararge aegeria aegeria TaxID=348720 RepID=A0A8S4QXF4_9NEOP|nr:jg14843 [Pararge aegeria aegeria]